MEEFELKNTIKELLVRYHSSPLPEIIDRDITFQDFKKVNKVVTVIGPRRAGKTFVLYQLMKGLIEQGSKITNFIYLNFENEKLAGLKADQLGISVDRIRRTL